MPVIQNPANDLGVLICNRSEKMQQERGNWDSYWDELARYFIPKKDNVYGQRSRGEVSEDFLYDNTSVHVNELLGSALHGVLTNPSSVFLGFGTGNELIDNDDEVQKWFQDTSFRLIKILNNSNFQTQVHEYYLDIGSLGTGVVKVEEDDKDIIRFESRPIYEHCVAENNKGIIDTVYRSFKWTVKQIVEEFGEKEVGVEVMDKLRNDPNQQMEIIHAIEPRIIQNLDPKLKAIPKNMPYRSVYVLKETKKVLSEGGFEENPYVVARWSKISGETYGRSPGMKALSDVKMLNAMMKVVIQAGQVSVAPPVQVPDDGVLLPIKLNPLGVNMYRAGSKDRIEPINLNARPDFGLDLIENVRERIRQAFFIDQLQLREGPQMTATEVMQRTEEQLRLMSPLMGRQHHEFLEPIVQRSLRIGMERNQFEEMPARLADALDEQKDKLQVKYISQIAKAQRTSEADTFGRFIQVIAPLIETQPEMLQNLDGDALARRMADILGVHHSIIRDKKDVEKDRKVAAKSEQQQQALNQGEQAAKIHKDMGGQG